MEYYHNEAIVSHGQAWNSKNEYEAEKRNESWQKGEKITYVRSNRKNKI